MNRKEGDLVKFKLGGDEKSIVSGRIVGVIGIAAIPQAIIGTNWIVKLDKKIDGWAYSCVSCFEIHIVN